MQPPNNEDNGDDFEDANGRRQENQPILPKIFPKSHSEELCRQFYCLFCGNLASNPVVSFCGHLFCWPCLCKKFLTAKCQSSGCIDGVSCPGCNFIIKKNDVIPMYGRGLMAEKTGVSASTTPPMPNAANQLRDKIANEVEKYERYVNAITDCIILVWSFVVFLIDKTSDFKTLGVHFMPASINKTFPGVSTYIYINYLVVHPHSYYCYCLFDDLAKASIDTE
uniref:RING-type E3 ubiquitin transferase n=1 Tax=Romanomermis culicivorax TaxID=13658 RepID=A0A915HFL2_ROMCU